MNEANAKLKYLHISPRKVRLLAGLVRGVPIKEAKLQIEFSGKKSAEPILKLLQSAEKNAVNNTKLKSENLYVKEMTVDEGPTLKRYKARARGRATTIRRRTSHITIVLSEQQKSEARNPK